MVSVANDNSYFKALKPKIYYNTSSAGNAGAVLFDAYAQTQVAGANITYCKVDLSRNHFGSFYIEIENSDPYSIDRLLRPNRLIKIDVSKTNVNYTTLVEGIIQELGFTRGNGGKTLLYVSGYGKGVRFNERVLDFNIPTPVISADGITEDFTNPAFKADALLDAAFANNFPGYSVVPTTGLAVGAENNYGIISSSQLQSSSNVEIIIPGIEQRYQEIGQIANSIEDYTDAIAYVQNASGNVRLEYDIIPITQTNGFVLKSDTIDKTKDNSDITGYFTDTWNFSDSYKKEVGYQNGMYSILGTTNLATEDPASSSWYTISSTNWYAARFQPKMAIIGTGDINVLMGFDNASTSNTVYFGGNAPFQIWSDNGNKPGAKIPNTTTPGYGWQHDNNFYYPGFWVQVGPNTTVERQWYSLQCNPKDNYAVVDPEKIYWLVKPATGAATGYQERWAIEGIQAAVSFSSNQGSSWTTTTDDRLKWVLQRTRSQPYHIVSQHGYLSGERNHVESTANAPGMVNSRNTMIKWLIRKMRGRGRPFRQYSRNVITMPNKAPLPGDVLVIEDNRLNLSSKQELIDVAFAGDISYEFGVQGGVGKGINAIGLRRLTLTPIGVSKLP